MWLRQSTASQEISLGQFLDSTDGNTEENALTIANTDIKLRKGGTTTLTNKNSGGATNISNGVYHATLDATDTNTLGLLEVYVHVAGALATKSSYMILPAASYDVLVTNGLNNFNPTSDTVANVTLVATTTTNTDMVGTDNALLAASYTAPDNASITLILADTNELQLNQGDWLTATGFSTSEEVSALNNISVSDIFTGQMVESYAADGVAPTMAQSLFLTMQNLQDFSFTGTTQTVNKLDGLSTAATYTLDDAVTPTSKTRAT